jgi:hypothetical protein
MLCFEVWRNGEKLTTAGVSETGVSSFILSWAGKEKDASSVAGSSAGTIPGMHCVVGGIDALRTLIGMRRKTWKLVMNCACA